MTVIVNRSVTPPPSCKCGAALRRRTSIVEGRCCCCRAHSPDEACQLCTATLYDFDGAGALCLRCQSVAA